MSRPDARDRIVDAAVARLRERGLSVALDGISLEEAIADSGVSRATAYRRWPGRAEFTRAVLVRVVRSVRVEPETEEEIQEIRAVLERHRSRVGTEAGRRTVIVEALRVACEADHRRMTRDRSWRDYLALRVTCDGLPDEELRRSLLAELRATEQAFTKQRAAVYSRIPELLGYRLPPPLTGEEGFLMMAETLGSFMAGFILDAAAGSEPSRFRARALGSEVESEWSTVSYGLTAALLGYLEPDPEAVWDPERAEARLQEIWSASRGEATGTIDQHPEALPGR